MAIIEAAGLRKVFRSARKEPGLRGAFKHLVRPEWREIVAVDGVDLEVGAGEAIAYVGPNGAGKSTTIKMLTGILKPSAGTVRVNGLDPYRDRMESSKRIGVVFGQRTQLWWDIAVVESFTLIRDIYDIPAVRYRDNLGYLTETLGLEEILGASARRLSLGQRMRADLAASLLHDPEIVFLDEPTIGLDVAVRERIRAFLRMINRERGVTIVLTSHDLDDIKDVCGRLVIIDEGTIIYDGLLQALLDRCVKRRRMVARLDGGGLRVAEAVSRRPGISVPRADEREVTVDFDRFSLTAKDVAALLMGEGEVVDFKLEEPDIEQVVRNVYEGRLDLGAGGPA
jgi:ABC-2 type transport system ATP-binding protein